MLNDETQRGKYMMNCSHGSQAATDCSKSCSIVSARQNIFMFRYSEDIKLVYNTERIMVMVALREPDIMIKPQKCTMARGGIV